MPQFNIGSKVIQITTGEHGIVIEVMQARRGRQLYKIEWSNGSVNDEFEVNLAPDSDTSDPFERCENGIFGTYSDYAKKNTTFKIKSSNDSTISSKSLRLVRGKSNALKLRGPYYRYGLTITKFLMRFPPFSVLLIRNIG